MIRAAGIFTAATRDDRQNQQGASTGGEIENVFHDEPRG
jgi:hypothetical protein